MNNTTEQVKGTEGTRPIVATIPVERITDFERKTKEQLRRHDDPSSDSIMRVGIRVGNQVAQAELRYETDWNNPSSGLRKQRIIKTYGVSELANTLDAIGITLDWTALFAEYKPLAEAWQVEREEARKLAFIKAYDESWAHKFVADAKLYAIEKVLDMTFVVTPDRERYTNASDADSLYNRDVRVHMTYKGKGENVWVEKGELRMYVDGFKTYRARKVSTLVERFRDAVDAQVTKLNRDQQTAQRRNDDLAIMQQRFPEFNITRLYNDSAMRAKLSTREFVGHVSVGYATNEARTAESFRIESIAMALTANEFKAIMDTLKAAQLRDDDREAERRAVNRRV